MKKEHLIFIRHILESINDIESFSENLSKEQLGKNKLKQYAIIRATEIIGEAVSNLPKSFRKLYPRVPWREIVGTRDKMIHHYFGVNLDIVWDIIKKDLPKLKEQIEKILKENKEEK